MATIASINGHLPTLAYFKQVYRLREWGGYFPSGIQTLECVIADVDESGECTRISDYAYGDAKPERHYYRDDGTVDITDSVESWMNGETDRRGVCRMIMERIAAAVRKQTAPPKSVTGLVPIALYASMHGLDPSTVRHKCIRGGWKTAVKLGRDWFIDPDEPHTDRRKKGDR